MPAPITNPSFPPLKDTALFKPVQLGKLELNHRVVLAPLTRMRAKKESDGIFVPHELNVEYYKQRASKGGLLLTEATDICHYASGYPGVPGVFSPSQLAGWKHVTDAVHSKGGAIFCQLWHTGRASPLSFRAGAQPVSSGTVPISGNALDGTAYGDNPPRALTVPEIHALTAEWAAAAKRAVEQAGFDGVEIHGANGYLLDQFLHDNVNAERADAYGGSVAHRCRFVLEVIAAVGAAVGGARTGVRLSPYNYFQDTKDSNPNAHWAHLCAQIAELPEDRRPAYVHMVEPRFDEVLDEGAKLDALAAYTAHPDVEAEATAKASPKNSLVPFRRILAKGGVKFFAAGDYKRENAAPVVEAGDADCVVFGRRFLANPDLPRRLAEGLPLNEYDRTTFYGADPPQKGYVDYPFFEEAVAA
ncbi:putative NADH:flavin oxidoreductase NADH oxidase protein [Botryosphaeria dothidea]|uniref:NADH:flavin oxidoreductase NADH oxidase protein n=1 Tax=Botryosphaeria dothidea TaxID=55169 RepID=A0A8H4IXD3_9PEZI|nr:putative NADH:flavin oxidoreductase NADH oxidase protein [Botryosphaeria dothidea]